MGLTQPPTAALKVAGVSAEGASDGRLFHSLHGRGKTGMQMDVCSGMGNSGLVCFAPGGAVAGGISIPSAGF